LSLNQPVACTIKLRRRNLRRRTEL